MERIKIGDMLDDNQGQDQNFIRRNTETDTGKEQMKDIFDKFLELFNKKTGEGAVEDYLEHPLNFAKSKGWAQILRGLTGLFGDLKKAIVDIVIGIGREIYEKYKTK